MLNHYRNQLFFSISCEKDSIRSPLNNRYSINQFIFEDKKGLPRNGVIVIRNMPAQVLEIKNFQNKEFRTS